LNGMWEMVSGTSPRTFLAMAVQQAWESSTFERTREVGGTIPPLSEVWWVVDEI
jgi:hypothetical protein